MKIYRCQVCESEDVVFENCSVKWDALDQDWRVLYVNGGERGQFFGFCWKCDTDVSIEMIDDGVKVESK